jgi:hypothetical protein
MEPLDLTSTPPRSPRAMYLGCMMLPRTVDKMRAEQPGGAVGSYFVLGPASLSGYVLHKLGIDVDQMRAAVASAASEDDVVAWLRTRVDPERAALVNAKLEGMRIDGFTPEVRAQMWKFYPRMEQREGLVTILDLLEADDAALTT